eukprot:773117-Pleurochrysis_carterae.AAC.2
MRERDLLRHVIETAPEGDAQAVLNSMDEFWDTYFNGAGSAEWKLRGSALDNAIAKAQPGLCMELGTYCGYTAVRIGRLLPPGAKLVSVEIEPLFAAIASKVHAACDSARCAASRKRPQGAFGVAPLNPRSCLSV